MSISLYKDLNSHSHGSVPHLPRQRLPDLLCQDQVVHPDDDQVLRRRQERLLALLQVVRGQEEGAGRIAEGERAPLYM